MGWEHNEFANWWNQFHGRFVAVALAVAVTLTISSFVTYISRYRALLGSRQG
jgi:hypothetical protein